MKYFAGLLAGARIELDRCFPQQNSALPPVLCSAKKTFFHEHIQC
jgi:hypothetical protein